jgi:hypothetical protein
MDNILEDHDQTLFSPPQGMKAFREKASATVEFPSNLTPMEIQEFLGSAFFNENATLVFHIESVFQPLVFSPAPQTTLGRVDQIDAEAACLNLSFYGAREQGMSRIHAMLHRSDVTLEIQDLDSKNGTYLNGYKLLPNETRVLRDRDELQLGKLRIRIAFQYGSVE